MYYGNEPLWKLHFSQASFTAVHALVSGSALTITVRNKLAPKAVEPHLQKHYWCMNILQIKEHLY